MDPELAAMLRSSADRLLAEVGGVGAATFAQRLDELGWREIPRDERAEAVRILFEAKGEALASADALTPVLVDTLTTAIGSIGASCHIGVPSTLRAGPSTCREIGTEVLIDAITFSEPKALVVPVSDGEGRCRLATLEVLHGLERKPVAGLDPDLGLWRITGRVAVADVTWLDDGSGRSAWDAVVGTGRRALAAELVAIARRLVRDASDYARSRHQYGRPIGSFQAVQHQLADAHVAVIGAEAIVHEATRDGSDWTALAAKALAGRAFDVAVRAAQQVFGAIGFTWEHHLHRFLRRGLVLDAIFGDWRRLEEEIGSRLVATRTLPRIGLLWFDEED